MNKVKMFFIAAALVLTTAGVFAGKAKFLAGDVYAYDPTGTGTFYPVAIGTTSGDLTTSHTGVQASISDLAGHAFALYSGNSTSFPLYTTVAF